MGALSVLIQLELVGEIPVHGPLNGGNQLFKRLPLRGGLFDLGRLKSSLSLQPILLSRYVLL